MITINSDQSQPPPHLLTHHNHHTWGYTITLQGEQYQYSLQSFVTSLHHVEQGCLPRVGASSYFSEGIYKRLMACLPWCGSRRLISSGTVDSPSLMRLRLTLELISILQLHNRHQTLSQSICKGESFWRGSVVMPHFFCFTCIHSTGYNKQTES